MRSLIFGMLLVSSLFSAKAQETSVEKSVFGIQTGFLGVWVHNESRLSNEFALRTELGLDAVFFGGSSTSNIFDGGGFLMAPSLTLEPRWYYNLEKRNSKSRRIDGNSGNFISLKTNYVSDLFTISNADNIDVIPQVSFIPKWGIRRNIGKHFNFETGIGLGISHVFSKSVGFSKNRTEGALDLHLRIGYRF